MTSTLLLFLACTPRLYTVEDTESSWVAPENDWIQNTPPEGLEAEGIAEGDVLADFRMADQHGQEVALWQFYGMTIVVDISTIWCAPCMELAEEVEATYQSYKDQGVMYLTVLPENLEYSVPTQEELAGWADAFEITAPVLADASGWAAEITPEGIFPWLLIVDKEMRVAVAQVLPPTDAQVQAELDAVLAE